MTKMPRVRWPLGLRACLSALASQRTVARAVVHAERLAHWMATALSPSRRPEDEAAARADRWWLRPARAVWLALVIPAYALLLAQAPFVVASAFHDPAAHSAPASIPSIALSPTELQRLHTWGLSLPAYGATLLLATLIFQLIYAAVGALLFWRRADDRMALFASFGLMMLPFGFSSMTLGALPDDLRWISPLLAALGNGTLIFCGYVFPDGWFRPRWARAIGVGLLVCSIIAAVTPASNHVLSTWTLLFILAFALGVVPVQAYRYRAVSTLHQRQQTKWVVWGISVSVVGDIAARILYSFVLRPAWGVGALSYGAQNGLIMLAMVAIPITVGVAILSSHLWDIDLVIHRTLVYSALSASLAAIYGGAIVILQTIFHGFTGQQRPGALVITLSTLIVAAMTNPLRRWLQNFIDRRFYRSHYRKGRVLKAFVDTMRHEVELSMLSERLLAVIEETMHPSHLSLWLIVASQDEAAKSVDALRSQPASALRAPDDPHVVA